MEVRGAESPRGRGDNEFSSLNNGDTGLLYVVIDSIVVSDLEDTGSYFDKQDPLVSIQIGKATCETERQEDAGTNATFPEKFRLDVTEEDLREDIIVEVLNKSIIGARKHVGIGRESVAVAIPKPNKDFTLSFDLTHRSKTEDKQKGKLTMRAHLVDMRPKEGCCIIS